MKKTTILLALVLTLLVPANIFADETDKEVTTDDTVVLYASKASVYSVKLPIRIDVSENNVNFSIFAKGDIVANKQLKISSGNSTVITDENGKGDVTVNIQKTNGVFDYDDLPAEYNDTAKVTFTLTHDTLAAGSYNGSLPITITLE